MGLWRHWAGYFVWLLIVWPTAAVGQNACDTLRPLTVRIDAGGPIGAGVIIAGDSKRLWIGTSGHVVQNAENIRIFFWDAPRTSVSARLEYRRRIEENEEDDVAFLTVPPSGPTPPPLPLRNDPIEEGEIVNYVGHPGELEWQCYPGNQRVSRRDYGPNKELFLFTNPAGEALHGLSGGPVSDVAGNLLGIIFGQISGNASAVKISLVLSLLNGIGGPPSKTIEYARRLGDVVDVQQGRLAPKEAALGGRTFFGYRIPDSGGCVEVVYSPSEFPQETTSALKAYFALYLKAADRSFNECLPLESLQLQTVVRDVGNGCIQVEMNYRLLPAREAGAQARSGAAAGRRECYGADSERTEKSATESAFANLRDVLLR
jgi:hypothetical protein